MISANFHAEVRQRDGGRCQVENAALVVDWHGGLIADGAFDALDGNGAVDVLSRVRVHPLDRCACEADERRIGQGLVQLAGEAVGHSADPFSPCAKPIMTAVRFTRSEDALSSEAYNNSISPSSNHPCFSSVSRTFAGSEE